MDNLVAITGEEIRKDSRIRGVKDSSELENTPGLNY